MPPRIRDDHSGQRATALESTVLYLTHGVGDGQAGQRRAASVD